MGPQTLGMISSIAEHEGSSKHSCLARMQFRIAGTCLILFPVNRKNKEYINPKVSKCFPMLF